MNHNPSNQHRVQISTRDAFRNLRISGYIANISDSKKYDKTDTPKMFTIVAQVA